jgi:hypothetical protein
MTRPAAYGIGGLPEGRRIPDLRKMGKWKILTGRARVAIVGSESK